MNIFWVCAIQPCWILLGHEMMFQSMNVTPERDISVSTDITVLRFFLFDFYFETFMKMVSISHVYVYTMHSSFDQIFAAVYSVWICFNAIFSQKALPFFTFACSQKQAMSRAWWTILDFRNGEYENYSLATIFPLWIWISEISPKYVEQCYRDVVKDSRSDSADLWRWNEFYPEWICLSGKRAGRCWQ